MSEHYKKSGVNIDEGNRFVDIIKPYVEKTRRTGVLGGLGGFGGFFQPSWRDYKEPVLVSGTDGVGTKLKLALDLKKFDTIGIDCVAMCVNDIACSGAEPLFFLDYLAMGKLEPELHSQVVKGIAEACKFTRCALIGGETAEMPSCYDGVEFDVAGFAVGIVEKSKIIDGSNVRPGNKIIGVASSGFHSNGYSLVNRLIAEHKLDLQAKFEDTGKTLGEVLLEPTRLYSPLIHSLLREFTINGIAHITGGGFWDNIPRTFPKTIKGVIEKHAWLWPNVMRYLQDLGQISDEEMLRVFNCGIGLVLVVPQEKVAEILSHIEGYGNEAWLIGEIHHHDADEPIVEIA